MNILNNIHFFLDNPVSVSTNFGTLYISAATVNVDNHDGHFVSIRKRRLENGQTVFDISEDIRDVMGRIMNNNSHRAFKLTFCQIVREVRYYLGNKKPTFSIEIMFVDESSRAYTDILIDFHTRTLARKYFKVIKDGLGIKKGFK